MRNKQVLIFIVLDDIAPILHYIENLIGIHYYKMGLFDSQDLQHYKTAHNLPCLGYTKSGDWNKIDSYLVMKRETPVEIHDVLQLKGGFKYAIDQMKNPKSIELKPGGIFAEKENVLIAGRIATISEDPDSIELFKYFSKKIKKEYRRIGSFYVGPKAEEMLKLGWRLVIHEGAPKEYDLAFE